jgi:hypothetical protein
MVRTDDGSILSRETFPFQSIQEDPIPHGDRVKGVTLRLPQAVKNLKLGQDVSSAARNEVQQNGGHEHWNVCHALSTPNHWIFKECRILIPEGALGQSDL